MKFPKNVNSYAFAGIKCRTNGIADYGVTGEKGENGSNWTPDEIKIQVLKKTSIDHITTEFDVTRIPKKIHNA